MFYSEFDTALCPMILLGDERGIQRLHLCGLEGSKRELKIDNGWQRNDRLFVDAIAQLREYAKGERQAFDLPLNLQGTEFQQAVWQQLRKIPFGQSCSYLDIARQIGNDKACRAVGAANGQNPVPIIVPCHRVVGANGKLTGFAFGLDIKEQLLDLESLTLASSLSS
jgi:methylated-DNA-[protein]-cysteine S-methyltransferase